MNEQERLYAFNTFMAAAQLPSDFVDWLEEEGFFRAPASTTWHGAYEGGLFDHSFAVAETLLFITQKMERTWCRTVSPLIVGMFHDLCKIDSYRKTEVGIIWNDKTQLFTGHGDKSVMLLLRGIHLTEEEILCIRYHMGAYETADWEYYGRAIKVYPNVLWTHTADMYASKVMGV